MLFLSENIAFIQSEASFLESDSSKCPLFFLKKNPILIMLYYLELLLNGMKLAVTFVLLIIVSPYSEDIRKMSAPKKRHKNLHNPNPFFFVRLPLFPHAAHCERKKKRQTKSGLTLCQRQKFVAKHSHKKYSGVREYKGRYARILSTVKKLLQFAVLL